jgi:hypothetical protein
VFDAPSGGSFTRRNTSAVNASFQGSQYVQ